MNQEMIEAYDLEQWSDRIWLVRGSKVPWAFLCHNKGGSWEYVEASIRGQNITGESVEAVLATAALQGRLT